MMSETQLTLLTNFEIARFSATATRPRNPLRPIRGAIGSIGFHLQSIVHPLNKPIKESWFLIQHVFPKPAGGETSDFEASKTPRRVLKAYRCFKQEQKWTCYNSWVYSNGIYSFSAPTLGSGKISPGVFLQLSGRCLTSRASKNPLDEGLFSCDFWASKAQHFF